MLANSAASGNLEATEGVARDMPLERLAEMRTRLARAITVIDRVYKERK
jgi:hypothetical protein